jgi:hypothetical protein
MRKSNKKVRCGHHSAPVEPSSTQEGKKMKKVG